MPAGYSKRPLIAKLGIKPSVRVCFVDAPDHYPALLGKLPPGVRVSTALRGTKDFIHCFVRERHRLAARMPALKRALEPSGMLWVSWPKRAAGVATDVTEDVVRELALASGLVDVKVCAVDEVWSGLKLVVPLKLR